MTKIFDIQKTIAAANGNTSLAKELFTMLLDDLDSRFQQIQSSFNSNNYKSLAEYAHKLYGATAYCIVPQLREATRLLDQALSDKEHAQLEKLVTRVLHEITQLRDNGPDYLQKEWIQESSTTES